MFSSNQNKEIIQSENRKKDDPLTIWLLRIACLLIIIFFSGLLVSIPILITFVKSQLNNSILNLKEILKSLIENSLA